MAALNDAQQEALSVALAGHSFLLSGQAGSGKSFTTGEIIKQLRDRGKNVMVTSSTGNK
jgi:DNA replication protein DnaC